MISSKRVLRMVGVGIRMSSIKLYRVILRHFRFRRVHTVLGGVTDVDLVTTFGPSSIVLRREGLFVGHSKEPSRTISPRGGR